LRLSKKTGKNNMLKERIIVKGMGIVSALGSGKIENVKMLRSGKSGMTPLSTSPFPDKIPACQIHTVPTDIKHRNDELSLIAIKEALDEAGIQINSSELSDCTLMLGTTTIDALEWEDKIIKALEANPDDPSIMFGQGSMTGQITCRIADRIGIRGTLSSFSTSCTSSLNALYHGMLLLQTGRAKRALVVGVDSLTSASIKGFSSLSLLNPEGCFPFDKERKGLLLGEGAAAILLEREDVGNSNQDIDNPVILSGYVGCDLSHPTASAADGSEGVRAMTAAIDKAGLDCSEIDGIKTHGTGSYLNDLAEGKALTGVFGDTVPPFTSLKRYYGHTLGASGVLELVAFLSSIKNGFIPASIGFTNMDEEIGIAPLQSNYKISKGNFLLNSFGFGGNMVSLVVKAT
jgi:3-oxoacyl-(acyl-carrier-protein) synthase